MKGGFPTTNNAPFVATPHAYKEPNGNIFVSVIVTDGVKTVLPKHPTCIADGTEISDVRMYFMCFDMSRLDNINMYGPFNYAKALDKLQPYTVPYKGENILLKALPKKTIEAVVCALKKQEEENAHG